MSFRGEAEETFGQTPKKIFRLCCCTDGNSNKIKIAKQYRKISRRKFLSALYGFKASCANITRNGFAAFYVAYFLNVCFESPSRSSLGMAYIVARSLTLTAYRTYSRHIIYLRGCILKLKIKPFFKRPNII